jgi:hypothetical protein
MGNLAELSEQLVTNRFRPDKPLRVSPGVYALFINNLGSLPGLTIGADQPLYIGMTVVANMKRNHFDHEDSGGSSPRRSLGALLREHLQLRAVPRADRDCTNYRFTNDGEATLTSWMRKNLSISHIPLDTDKAAIARIEKQLIANFKPPLNLSGFPADDARRRLAQLRNVCRDEARDPNKVSQR